MTRYTPLWQQAGSYAASVDRNLFANLFPAGGANLPIPTVVANTMNVTIPPGRAAVVLQAGANVALCAWDANEVVTSLAAPPAGNTRIDLVILQVRDPQLDAGVNNDFLFQVLAGANSTGTPVAPTVPANALPICSYTVPAVAANLNGVTITRVSGATGPPPVYPTAAALGSAIPSPPRGMLAVTTDTDTLWQAKGSPPVWQPPPGTLIHAEGANMPDYASSALGTRDLTTILTLTYPYPTTCIVWWSGLGGFAGGACAFAHDMQVLWNSAIYGSNTANVWCQAAFWAADPIGAVYTVPANTNCAYKLRQTINNNGGGSVHTGGNYTAQVFAA
jgi:hypothetical protein